MSQLNFKPNTIQLKQRPARLTHKYGRHSARTFKVSALFGGDRDWKKEREEMFEQQQEILRARRSGDASNMESVNERRRRLSVEARQKELDKKKRRDLLAQGIRPEREEYKPYDEEMEKGSIIIPIAPFGIPKFDNGERFDLKSPYTDEGWVDPDADPFKWLKNMFGGKKEEEGTKSDEQQKRNEKSS
eukprot:TRINITY_DN684_c0_g1_i2.p3 TRINITY_DN684_c0_g1~~TRINITY_DN684_c0_g1_i2.p3  ORF type:complete len:188 (-),score=37.87 TRINITY_DN684_c0_g1_i2:285-848(-)